MNNQTCGLILCCIILFLSLIIHVHDASVVGHFTDSILSSSKLVLFVYVWFPAIIVTILCVYLYRHYKDKIWIVLLLLTLYYTCSYNITIYSQYQYLPQLQYLYCFAAMPITFLCVSSDTHRMIFCFFLACMAVLQSLVGIAQEILWIIYEKDFPWFVSWLKPLILFYLHDGEQAYKDTIRVVGTIIDPNNLGLFLVLCGSACIPLYYDLTKKWMKYTFAWIHGIIGIGIYLTFSKSSWIATGFYVFIIAVLYRKYLNRYILISTFIVGVFCAVLEGDRIWNRLSSFDMNSKSNSNRIIALQASVAMIKDFPFFGIGVGNFHNYFERYKPSDEMDNRYYCMNSHLQILVETGAIGFLLYSTIIIYILYTCFKSSNTFYDKRILYALSLIVICINASFSQMLLLVPNSLYFWSLLGFIYSSSKDRN